MLFKKTLESPGTPSCFQAKDIPFEVLGTGVYLPKRKISTEEMAKKVNANPDWIKSTTGVHYRYFVEDETAGSMGAFAAEEAIKNAGISKNDIDVIVSACGTTQQQIPCNAVHMQHELGLGESGIPSFDVSTTCSSFLTGLEVISSFFAIGKYQTALIISSDVSSGGLSYSQKESAPLFGDGAAAWVVRKPDKHHDKAGPRILFTHHLTYSVFKDAAKIEAGGSKIHTHHDYNGNIEDKHRFQMNGRKIFGVVLKYLPDILHERLGDYGITLEDVDVVIPHQSSKTAMNLIIKRLGLEGKAVIRLKEQGNIVAVSMPLTFHTLLKEGKIKKGNKVLFIGTAAGIHLNLVLLEY